jgi:hypothetical protein
MIDNILRFLRQPSTYKGLSGVLAAFGLIIEPDLWAEIGTALVAIVGVIEIIRDEDKPIVVKKDKQ